ncbi:hypothetical protein ACQ4PT_068673 [Festuca glaucescens]
MAGVRHLAPRIDVHGDSCTMDFQVGDQRVPLVAPTSGNLGIKPIDDVTAPSKEPTVTETAKGADGERISRESSAPFKPSIPDLGQLLHHFWEAPRVSTPPSRGSFGWWPGKIAGDSRSFAQVVASPPHSSHQPQATAIGDRGGGRGVPRGGGGGGRGAPVGGKVSDGLGRGRNNVWQRDVQEGSGQNSPTGGSGSRAQEDRWEAAAQMQGTHAAATKGNRIMNQQPPRPARNDGRVDPEPCANCNGFVYFPDSSTPQQVKEKASTVIIIVVEGHGIARDTEKEFNEGIFFGPGWRCTARTLSPVQFSMRFPNPKEVDRACRWGNEMKMRTKNAILKLTPWSDDVGASSKLQKAWVRVRNIPCEKRNEAHAAFVGSLVGVTLDIDKSTLHHHEYVRILPGCRDVEKIPEKAEGCMGDNFYVFYYEVDKVIVGKQPNKSMMVHVDSSSGAPSPKRARNDNPAAYESSEGQIEGQHVSGSTSYGKSYAPGLETVSEHESEEDSEDDNGLLIDEIIRDKNAEIPISKKAVGRIRDDY